MSEEQYEEAKTKLMEAEQLIDEVAADVDRSVLSEYMKTGATAKRDGSQRLRIIRL